MPSVNRESVVPTLSPEFDATPSELPPSLSSAQLVESFDSSKNSPMQQQGGTVGSINASTVGQLDAKAVVGQVKELMTGWRVSDDDCKHAVGLLQSLPPAEYAKALKQLSQSGDLRTLCESSPAAIRRELAESALQGGATTETPARFASGEGDPQPPAQPALIVNSPSLPMELREVIHGQNKIRARQYEADFNRYADAWCAKVKTCKSPMDLRAMGPLSTPPALTESGISEGDFAAKRFVTLQCQTNMGVQRAEKAVSDQVSAFRGELAAGGFGLDFQVKGQLTFEGEQPGHTEAAFGAALIAKGTLTQDGRVINQHVEEEGVLEGTRGPVKVEAKFDKEGHLEAVAAEVAGAGVTLERNGKVTLAVPVAPGVSVESFVDANKATYGGAIVAEEEGHLFGGNLQLQAKIGFSAKGIDRAYYADIGGTQQGFFGPMPELDDGIAWRMLPKERRDWYERQGFSESSWP